MKTEISGRTEIELLVNKFYEKVQKDDLIGFFFTAIIPVDWDKHLPVMYDFWEGIVFGTGTYQGNTMAKHLNLHNKSSMESKHFERWLELFNTTVDENFIGSNALLIKQRALSISTVIQIKIAGSIKN
ncbi:MAG: group III truncated hemoglobin [Bacteroidetes bacterium]|nr:group III truncated hemoglobin [Bacteroidota bacterium]